MSARRILFAIVAMILAGACGAQHVATPPAEVRIGGGIRMPAGRHSVSAVVKLLREDHHLPLSFIEGDENASVVLDETYAGAQAVLDEIVRQLPEYRVGPVRGHLFLYTNEPRYQQVISDVALRNATRQDAMYGYLELLRKRPEFERLIPPGTLGRLTQIAPENDPMRDVLSLSSSATVMEHFAELLADDRWLTVTVASFQWGNEGLADGFAFVEVLPLAFEPPVYGKSPLAAVPDIDYGSRYASVLMEHEIARNAAGLLGALAHERVVVREAAAWQLGFTAAKGREAALRKALSDRAISVRLIAAESLLRLGDTSGFAITGSAATYAKDVDVRMSGIAGLGAFARNAERRGSAIDALKKIARDDDRFIRAAAVRSLGIAGAREVLRELAAAETDAEVRQLMEKVR